MSTGDFSRKDLKQQDDIQRGFTAAAHWLVQRRKALGIALLIGLAGASVVAGVRSYRTSQERDAAALLSVALRAYNAPIVADDDSGLFDEAATGIQTFSSEEARAESAIASLQAVTQAYPTYPSGRAAAFYRGLALARLDRPDEARPAFEAAAGGGPSLIRAMARYRLGDLHMTAGDHAAAIAEFELLLGDTESGFPVEEALTAKARAHEAAGELQAAMLDYQRIADDFVGSVYALPARTRAEEIAAQLGVTLESQS